MHVEYFFNDRMTGINQVSKMLKFESFRILYDRVK